MHDWPHQVFACEEVDRLYDAGHRAMCLTAPTGTGKSLVIQRILERFNRRGMRSVLFTNRKLLTNQIATDLAKVGMRFGVRAAGFEAWQDYDAPIQICSAPTEVSRVLGRREKMIDRGATEEEAHERYSLFPADIVINDEAHMAKSPTMCGIIDEYRSKWDSGIVGITATPLGIGHIYDDLIIACNNSQALAIGAIVPASPYYEPATIDIPKIRKTKTGIFSQEELEKSTRAVWSQHIVGHIHKHWVDIADGRPTIGMAPGVKESVGLAQEFWNRGINAAHISADLVFVDGKEYRTTEHADRQEIFDRSKAGEIPVIFNRFVLREAINLPWISCMILATPIASLLSYLQVVGRSMRAFPGKTNAIIIDHANNRRMHGDPNWDRDQDWRAYFHRHEDDITKDRLDKLRDPNNTEPEPITCPKCFAQRDSGYKCPFCGFEYEKSVRFVIQESGRLKAVSSEFIPKRRIRIEKDTAQIWEQCYWRMRRAKNPKSFRQVNALFKKENGYFPPDDLPFMPKYKSDWGRKVRDVAIADLVPKPKYEPAIRNAGEKREPLPVLEPVATVSKPKRVDLFDDVSE